MKKLFLIFPLLLTICCADLITEPPRQARLKSLYSDPNTYYLYQNNIASGRRDLAHPVSTERLLSKAYSGSFIETPTEYLLFCVADNNAHNIGIPWHVDQTFLKYKSKSDGLEFYEGWQWYVDGSGNPIPVMASGVTEADGLAGQQTWLATPTLFGDTLVAHYSVNTGNLTTRHSWGRAISLDWGRTWIRDANFIKQNAGGANPKSYYQFQQVYYNASKNIYVALSPNLAISTAQKTAAAGRAMLMNVETSTDGINFTQTSSNIFSGTSIDEQGFGLLSPIFQEPGDSTYYFYAGAVPVPDFTATGTHFLYPWMNKQIVLVSCPDLTVANPTLTIERVIYETDYQNEVALFPGSKKITHNGKDYIIANRFTWIPEDSYGTVMQVSIDVCVLTNTPFGTTVNTNIYPDHVKKIFKMHQTHLDDNFGSSTVYPIELIDNTGVGLINTVTQERLNRVKCTSTGYVQAQNFDIDNENFGLFTWATLVPSPFNAQANTYGLIEKDSSFTVKINNNKLILKLCGNASCSLYKEFKATSTMQIDKAAVFRDYVHMGFKFKPGATDLEVKLYVD